MFIDDLPSCAMSEANGHADIYKIVGKNPVLLNLKENLAVVRRPPYFEEFNKKQKYYVSKARLQSLCLTVAARQFWSSKTLACKSRTRLDSEC